MTVISVDLAQAQLAELVRRAVSGEEVVLLQDGHPVAAIKALGEAGLADAPPKPQRVPGTMKGQFRVSADCWETDEELIALFEDGPVFPESKPKG